MFLGKNHMLLRGHGCSYAYIIHRCEKLCCIFAHFQFARVLYYFFTGELLDTLPPGVDEVVAISKVVSFLKAPEYEKFTRIILDTAPTGHTLRLLTLPDFIDATVGKVIRLRAKLTNAAAAVKGIFGVKAEKDQAVEKLEALKVCMPLSCAQLPISS